MHTASKKCIPSSKIEYYKEYIVPVFNEHVKELHDIARHEFVMRRSADKPRFEKNCLSMNQSRLRFKSALKYCQQNENIMRADSLARSIMNNDITDFWKDVHKITHSEVPLATKLDRCVGNANIADMWKCHYKSLLNSVENKNCKTSVMLDINKHIKNSIIITPFNILDALKNIMCGKSSSLDGISTDHFVFAHSNIQCYCHYYFLPLLCMVTFLVCL